MLRGECVNGRWAGSIKAVQPDGEIKYSRGEDDWQGTVMFIAKLDDGNWLHCEWSYGSCTVCDSWEGMDEKQQTEEMKKTGRKMTRDEMLAFALACQEKKAAWVTGDQYYMSQHVGLSFDDLLGELRG